MNYFKKNWILINSTKLFFLGILAVVGIVYSVLIPPIQSPDEDSHLKRAYLLQDAHIFVNEIVNGVSGGYIDANLLEYMSKNGVLVFKKENKYTAEIYEPTEKIKWAEKKVYSTLPNTLVYFPMQYLPQALAIKIGRLLNMNVGTTLWMARIFTLSTSIFLIFLAMRLYAVPTVVFLVLFLPMSIFQFGAASIDSISFALSILIVSIFCKIATEESASVWLFSLLTLLTFTFCTTRINFIFLAIGPIYLAYKLKNFKYLMGAIFSALCGLFWILWALVNIRGITARPYNTISVINSYIHDGYGFFSTIARTFTDLGTLQFYRMSFIGVLGWLDSPMTPLQYNFLTILFLVGLFFFWKNSKHESKISNGGIVIGFLVILSLVAIWPILLLAVTDYPAFKVEGLQGRYLIPPVVMLMTIFLRDGKRGGGGYFLATLVILTASGIVFTTKNLVERYYISTAPSVGLSIVNDTCCKIFGDLVSGRKFVQTFKNKGSLLQRVELKFANYNNATEGNVTLNILGDKDIKICSKSVPVKDIKDGNWVAFDMLCPPLLEDSYRIAVESNNVQPGLTLWASEADSYSEGYAIVDGEKVTSDFVFKVIYVK